MKLAVRVGLVCLVAVLAAGARAETESVRVFRVYYEQIENLSLLDDFDVFEFRDRREHYVLVGIADDAELGRLRSLGLRHELDLRRTEEMAPAVGDFSGAGIPGYPCYRTVEETYQTAEQIVSENPTLAEWNDIGDSWEKQQGLGGFDLRVLKLTNQAVAGPKPKLVATCSIHAREYTPAELCTRFAELLVDGYDIDADATWLLDHHEVHLVLHANPDGRKRAETGLSWRKNVNQNHCSPTSSNRGADLNRNFEFEWGCCGGSSGNECSSTYRGPAPSSEPEVQAYQAYLRQEFPDQRGPDPDDPAPSNATGVYLDIHSYSELVLWPWGFGGDAPNEPELKTLGRKLAYFNDYFPEPAVDLYPTDGTTIDFGYGDLGVASYVFELGTTFFQSCSNFQNTILPDNLEALLYAAKVARTPYRTPAGPDSLNPTVSGGPGLPGTLFDLSATANDTRYSSNNGTESSQAVVRTYYTVDTPPWETGAVEHDLAAVDGSFGESIETASGTVDTASLTPGRHTLFVQSQDFLGNRGAVSAVFLDLLDPAGDQDLDGTANGSDCALSDPSLWSEPAAISDLTVSRARVAELTWTVPREPGADAVVFDVVRSVDPLDFSGGVCVDADLVGNAGGDGLDPAPGGLYAYLVRVENGCGSAAGAGSRVLPGC